MELGLSWGGAKVLIIGFITTPLAVIALGMRLWSRQILKNRLRFSDYMVIVGFLFAIATVAICFRCAWRGSTGRHVAELLANDPGSFTEYILLNVPAQFFWAIANTSVKFSILSLYLDIFPNRTFQRLCYGAMVVSGCYLISVILEGFLLCTPVQYNWDKSVPGGKCTNQSIAYLLAAITNLIVDTVVVSLPIPLILKLHLSLEKRLGIAAMFGLGFLICIFSLLRVVALATWDLTDITWTTTDVSIYSILEPNLGVVNACLPTIRPAVVKAFGRCLPASWSVTQGSKGSKGSKGTNRSSRVPNEGTPHFRSVTGDRGFERLDDDILLTQVRGGEPLESQNHDESRNISITHDWTVKISGKGDGHVV